MARPAEKARAMLNKWVAMREGDSGLQRRQQHRRRPHLASECEHLADAERFRNQIVREIADKIAKIQNPALPEHDLRELNDSINALMREKYHWNKRIYALGGLDYNAIERQRRVEQGGGELEDGATYKYYGAARELPGVKEHLEKLSRPKVPRKELHKNLTPDYFGWRDEEDGVLLELEEEATRKMLRSANLKRPFYEVHNDDDDDDYLAVPSQDEILKAILEQKKKALLQKYAL
jgi:pre-mRNA-splicing factor ISY1